MRFLNGQARHPILTAIATVIITAIVIIFGLSCYNDHQRNVHWHEQVAEYNHAAYTGGIVIPKKYRGTFVEHGNDEGNNPTMIIITKHCVEIGSAKDRSEDVSKIRVHQITDRNPRGLKLPAGAHIFKGISIGHQFRKRKLVRHTEELVYGTHSVYDHRLQMHTPYNQKISEVD